MVTRPLANTSAGAHGLMRCLVVVVVMAWAAGAAAQGIDLAPYQTAQRAGHTGAVVGRVYEERRQPSGSDRPLVGAAVTLMPHSSALVDELERIRQGARDSADAYRAAAPSMRRLRESYERRVWDAGAPDLVRSVRVDGEGTFHLPDVPAGRWLLLATHAAYAERGSRRATRRESQMYSVRPRVVGFESVTMWVRDVVVQSGGTQTFELSDRNAWFTGVAEDTMLDTGR